MERTNSQSRDGILAAKIARLRDGKRPRVLDLFSGCGGLTLGFRAAGFEPVGGVELDPDAAASHAMNFFPSAQEVHGRSLDMTRLTPQELARELGFDDGVAGGVDVVVGGPPCQAYARVGRAKLREVLEHPTAFRVDPRGNLFLRYLHFVEVLRPVAILMENVPDVLNYGGHNIAEEVADVLEELGYRCRYTLLNSAFYGVPQSRERMYLVAIDQRVDREFRFPAPIRWANLPDGYKGTRSVALKTLGGRTNGSQRSLFDTHDEVRFVAPPEPRPDLPRAISAEEALRDLPFLDAQALLDSGELRRGRRGLDQFLPYRDEVEPSPYGHLMRSWPSFLGNSGIHDHAIRYLPRDYKLFRRMKPGDQYPQLHQMATAWFESELAKGRSRGEDLREGSDAYEALKREFVPPYSADKFPNKWRKMEPDSPARTLMAHLGKDSYSHIHYDSRQGRTISVREAARLQSFPDGFLFHGTMNPAFRQIGNAVPPLMGYAIAREIRRALGCRNSRDIRRMLNAES